MFSFAHFLFQERHENHNMLWSQNFRILYVVLRNLAKKSNKEKRPKDLSQGR